MYVVNEKFTTSEKLITENLIGLECEIAEISITECFISLDTSTIRDSALSYIERTDLSNCSVFNCLFDDSNDLTISDSRLHNCHFLNIYQGLLNNFDRDIFTNCKFERFFGTLTNCILDNCTFSEDCNVILNNCLII